VGKEEGLFRANPVNELDAREEEEVERGWGWEWEESALK